MLAAHVITLISPEASDLVGSMITQLQQAVPISQVDWLAADRACDLFVQGEAIDSLRIKLDTLLPDDIALDMVIQPVDRRKKELLICDMDSTMIMQECIDELAGFMGIKEQVSDVTERAMCGEIDFEEALKERVSLLKGLPQTALEDVWRKHIALTEGGKVLLATMKANGAYTALVSGGFTFFTAQVAQVLGFDEHHANILEVENGMLTGMVAEPILDKQSKLFTLHSLSHKHHIARDAVMAVGDGANDLPMLQAAGMGVAYHGKPVVQEGAAAAINYNDLSALLFIQGYRESEFCV